MTPRTLVAAYFTIQASAGAAWWSWVLRSESAREMFLPADGPAWVWQAFAAPDLALFVGVSAAAAWSARSGAAWAATAAWLACGAASYATLYCIVATALTGQAWLGAAVMCLAAVGTTWAAATAERLRR